MAIITKAFAIAMLPFSIFIILKAANIFSLNFPFNEIALGAILMITLQLLNLAILKGNRSPIRPINIITFVVFVLPAAAYFVAALIGDFLQGYLPLILGVMMLVEGLYALH